MLPSAPQPSPRTGSLPNCGTERKSPKVHRGPVGGATVVAGTTVVAGATVVGGVVVAGSTVVTVASTVVAGDSVPPVIVSVGSVVVAGSVVGVVTPGSGSNCRRSAVCELHAGAAIATESSSPNAKRRMW